MALPPWWSNSSNLAQKDFLVYNAAGGETSRSIAAPRLTEIWNLAIDKLLHDPHVQTCYRTLGRSGYEHADLKSWQRALRASPGLSPMVTKSTKPSELTIAEFDPNFPNNIKLDMDLVCALEAAEADSTNFICLSFIVLQVILHDASHWIIHRTRGYSDESLRYGNFYGGNIGDDPSSEARSGYLMESMLWGGIVKWGYPYGPWERQLFKMTGMKWKKITGVAIQYDPKHESDQFYMIDVDSMQKRLQGNITPFTKSDYPLMTTGYYSGEKIWSPLPPKIRQ